MLHIVLSLPSCLAHFQVLILVTYVKFSCLLWLSGLSSINIYKVDINVAQSPLVFPSVICFFFKVCNKFIVWLLWINICRLLFYVHEWTRKFNQWRQQFYQNMTMLFAKKFIVDTSSSGTCLTAFLYSYQNDTVCCLLAQRELQIKQEKKNKKNSSSCK